jgi:hypothetical protein
MALFNDGQLCHYCRQPMTSDQDLIGFTFLGSTNPLIRPIDDSVVHADCLSQHPQRDEIVAAWNGEAAGCGPQWMLSVSRGTVRHFTWLDRFFYRLGIRQISN